MQEMTEKLRNKKCNNQKHEPNERRKKGHAK